MSARVSDRCVLGTVLGVVTLLALAGCADESGPTCGELGEKDASGKLSTLTSLVRDNGLDPYSNVVGLASIEQDVYKFCGISAVAVLTGGNHAATKNIDAAIGEAVDWESYGK